MCTQHSPFRLLKMISGLALARPVIHTELYKTSVKEDAITVKRPMVKCGGWENSSRGTIKCWSNND